MLRLFPVSKTEETHKRTEICYDQGDKNYRWKSWRIYQKVLIRSASRIGKSAGTTEGDYFDGNNIDID